MSRKPEPEDNFAQDEPVTTPAGGGAQAEPAAIRQERDDLLSRLQRVSADYLNYQKRVKRDLAEATEYANADLIKSLLGVLDDMQRALEAARSNHSEDDPLLQGMQLVYDKAMETLSRYGLSEIAAEGESFDPNRHNALMQQPTDAHPAGIVLKELQKGFMLKGRTIRPAAVVVSTPADSDGPGEPPAGSDPGDE